MSGKKSHRVGYALEKRVVDKHDHIGIFAERIRQGGLRNNHADSDTDVEIYPYGRFDGRLIQIQCKKKKSGDGFKSIYQWLGENEFLVVQQTGKQPLYCMKEETYLELMQIVARAKSNVIDIS